LGIHFNTSGRASSSEVPHARKNYGHKPSESVGPGTCSGLWKSAAKLEPLIIAQIASAAASGAIERVVLDDIRTRQRASAAPSLSERDKLALELSDFGNKFSQWADRLDDGKIDEEQFALQNRRLLDRKQELQNRLKTINAELEEDETIDVSFAEIKQALKDFPVLWTNLEAEEQREVLRLLVEYLRVYRTHVELKLLFHEPVNIAVGFNRGRPKKGTALGQ